MAKTEDFTKYERARILGARALQISMDAPLLMKIDKEDLEGMSYDPLKIAQKELDSGVLPITINRPLPHKKEEKFREISMDEAEEKKEKLAEKEKADAEEAAAGEKKEEVTEMKSDEELEEEVEEAAVAGDDSDDGGLGEE